MIVKCGECGKEYELKWGEEALTFSANVGEFKKAYFKGEKKK